MIYIIIFSNIGCTILLYYNFVILLRKNNISPYVYRIYFQIHENMKRLFKTKSHTWDRLGNPMLTQTCHWPNDGSKWDHIGFLFYCGIGSNSISIGLG